MKGYFFSRGGRTTFSAFLSKFLLLLFMPLRKHSWNWNNYLQSTVHFTSKANFCNKLLAQVGWREGKLWSWMTVNSQGRSSISPTILLRNWLLFWKMTPLVVPLTCVKFKSASLIMRNEQWIFYENFTVFGQIENLWMDKIASKTCTSNSR